MTKMMNGTQSMSSCFNPTATRIGKTLAYSLIFVVSLFGNILLGMIVYRKKSLRTPINILIVNMAISDLLVPIFLFPRLFLTLTTGGYWPISGPLGQEFCKLRSYTSDVSGLKLIFGALAPQQSVIQSMFRYSVANLHNRLS